MLRGVVPALAAVARQRHTLDDLLDQQQPAAALVAIGGEARVGEEPAEPGRHL